MDSSLLMKLIENISLFGFMALMLQYFVNRCEQLYSDYEKMSESRYKGLKKQLDDCNDDKKKLYAQVKALELRFLKGGT